MHPLSRHRPRDLAALFAAVLAIAALVLALHWSSPRLPGTAGEIFRRNLAQEVEATALFYTEVGELGDYPGLSARRLDRDPPRP